mgnify:CR=1 FL=1
MRRVHPTEEDLQLECLSARFLQSGPCSTGLEHTQKGKNRDKDDQSGSNQVDPDENGAVLRAFEQAIEVGGGIAVATLYRFTVRPHPICSLSFRIACPARGSFSDEVVP